MLLNNEADRTLSHLFIDISSLVLLYLSFFSFLVFCNHYMTAVQFKCIRLVIQKGSNL